jgi:pilus assembly protein CpaF
MGIFGKNSGNHDQPDELKKDEQNSEQPVVDSQPIKLPLSVSQQEKFKAFRTMAYATLMERIDVVAVNQMTPDYLRHEIEKFIGDLAIEHNVQMNTKEQKQMASSLVDDMLGLGPLEEILHDESVTDILVNNANNIYVERKGKLEKINIHFIDEAHVQQIARRIASRIGRRIDESSPMVDARLADGSRVNIIMPPLALDGTTISIRKFSHKNITIDKMVENGNLSESMGILLKVAAACRLNMLMSGGTGSGKTTLLNATSQLINSNERIVTIEDSAELRLQQPHVVRLESRPPNIEGEGEITIRDLVRNALRMRPDRIIVGEVRGEETMDMLQAMNTGHDGSMSTIHANRPREVLTRLENMMTMSGFEMPIRSIRSQIVGAVNLIVHTERMRDGVRRVTEISEITGIEGDVIMTHSLFKFEFQENQAPLEGDNARIQGTFKNSGVMPQFAERARFFGLEKELREALKEGM